MVSPMLPVRRGRDAKAFSGRVLCDEIVDVERVVLHEGPGVPLRRHVVRLKHEAVRAMDEARDRDECAAHEAEWAAP